MEGAIGITLCFSCVTPAALLLLFSFKCEDELKLDKLPNITYTSLTITTPVIILLTYRASLMVPIQITG